MVSRIVTLIAGALFAASCDQRTQSTENPVAAYDLQSRCAKDASAWFKGLVEQRGDPDSLTVRHNYTNHYSKKMGKCFLVATRYSSWHDDKTGKDYSTDDKELFDVLENKLLGSFDKSSDRAKPNECRFGDAQCTSDTDWDTLAKRYMEN